MTFFVPYYLSENKLHPIYEYADSVHIALRHNVMDWLEHQLQRGEKVGRHAMWRYSLVEVNKPAWGIKFVFRRSDDAMLFKLTWL